VLRKLTTGPYGELWSSTFVSRRRHAEWKKCKLQLSRPWQRFLHIPFVGHFDCYATMLICYEVSSMKH